MAAPVFYDKDAKSFLRKFLSLVKIILFFLDKLLYNKNIPSIILLNLRQNHLIKLFYLTIQKNSNFNTLN